MTRSMLLLLVVLLSSCASFDKTNIRPGQRVDGLGFSFAVPTQNAWFAVEYGNGHRIKLSQLNDVDSYSILISLNRGPVKGMFPNAQAHLKAVQRHRRVWPQSIEFTRLRRDEWLDSQYGELCVRYSAYDEDWRGRNRKGPAMVELIGLSCEHPEISNVLIRIDITRRHEVDAPAVDLAVFADELFSSIEYESIE